jgi:hypothetical protein
VCGVAWETSSCGRTRETAAWLSRWTSSPSLWGDLRLTILPVAADSAADVPLVCEGTIATSRLDWGEVIWKVNVLVRLLNGEERRPATLFESYAVRCSHVDDL